MAEVTDYLIASNQSVFFHTVRGTPSQRLMPLGYTGLIDQLKKPILQLGISDIHIGSASEVPIGRNSIRIAIGRVCIILTDTGQDTSRCGGATGQLLSQLAGRSKYQGW